MTDTNPGRCELCSVHVEDRCGDGVCRACHKSLTFESCLDGSWIEGVYRECGIPSPRQRKA